MTEDIVRLESNDYEEALDFLALIFANNNDRPHNFDQMFPLVYRPTPDRMACNYAIRRNGRIVCMVTLFPITWNVAGKPLRIGGIGGVSSHPRWRGHGFMSTLMKQCVETMKAEGYCASWLGGLRQRYAHFGYEKCGLMLEVSIRKGNYETRAKGPAQIHFEIVAADDQDLLAQVKALYDAQIMHCELSMADFFDRCMTWYGQLFAAYDLNGDLLGYVVVDKRNGRISEVVLSNTNCAPELLYSWMDFKKTENVTLEVLPFQLDLARALHPIVENMHAARSGNWQIFNWPDMIEGLMQTRASVSPMREGAALINIEQAGTMDIRYVDGTPACCVTAEHADLQVSPAEAMRILFGPVSPSFIRQIPESAIALESWCPLPLGWANQDKV